MRPSGLTIVLMSILTLFAGFASFVPGSLTLWKISGSMVAGLLLIDIYFGKTKLPDIFLKRTVKHSLPVGVWSKVHLELKNLESYPVTLKIYDHHPDNCETSRLPVEHTLIPGKSLKTYYKLCPRKKGDMEFKSIDLLILSPMKLWWNRQSVGSKEQIKVFPNFREIKKFSLLATDSRLSQIGIIKKQKRGEGSDFHQLREYRPGDSFRQIDWNKTSCYGKPITKEYQDERDQQVLFLLDCGRRMRHMDEKESHFDQALNAMLLLSYVAVLQDDAVGFMTFGGVSKWFPPRKNANTIKHMLNQVYNLHPTTEAADYLSAAKSAAALQKRRSLIVIVTNTRDEDHDDLLSAMNVLKKKHLVVLADLREKILDVTLKGEILDLNSAVLFNSVNTYLESRKKHHKDLSHQGILTLNTLADNLPSSLVNKYLMIKANGKL